MLYNLIFIGYINNIKITKKGEFITMKKNWTMPQVEVLPLNDTDWCPPKKPAKPETECGYDYYWNSFCWKWIRYETDEICS